VKRITARPEIKHFVMAITPETPATLAATRKTAAGSARFCFGRQIFEGLSPASAGFFPRPLPYEYSRRGSASVQLQQIEGEEKSAVLLSALAQLLEDS
jgi:hypothetical protein